MKLSENIFIQQGDCLELIRKLPDNYIDAVVTDPPYKIVTGGDSNGKNSIRPKGILSGNKKLFKYNIIQMKDWLFEVYRVLKDNSHCYVFTNSLNLKDILIDAESTGFKLHNILVWEKNNCTPNQFYMKNCEYILFLRKGKAKWINNIGESKTVHKFNNIIGNKVHPTQKPVDLMEFYIKNSTRERDVVLDLFMGSGSTGVACINTNRRFIGYEKDEKYFEIAKNRLIEQIKNDKIS